MMLYQLEGAPDAAERRHRREDSRAAEPAPLAHFFVLERGERPACIERLTPRDAFTALSRCLHRLAPDDPEAMRAEFHLLGEVSARVPVSRLSFAHDFAALMKCLGLSPGGVFADAVAGMFGF